MSLIRMIGAAVSAALMSAQPGNAENVGAEFARMPVNMKLEYSSGRAGGWTNIYRGKRGGLYVMERYSLEGELEYVAYFNADGLLLRREYANGNVRTFTPHHCFGVIGECSYAYANSQGRDGTGTAKTTLQGKNLTYSWRANGRTRSVEMVLGQYNLHISGRDVYGTSWKLEKVSTAN